MVIIAHNSAAWVVQDVILQMPYSQSILDVPAGVVFFGLPHAPFRDEWQEASWENFSQALIHHLNRRDMNSKLSVRLDFHAVETTMSEFQSRLKRLGQLLQIKTISCSGTRVSRLYAIFAFESDHERPSGTPAGRENNYSRLPRKLFIDRIL